MVASSTGVALMMAGCAIGDAETAIACLFLAGIAHGWGSSAIYATGQTLAGPHAAGKWIGIQNCIGNLAGIVAPIVTGLVVDRTGEFYWAFVVACGVAVLGAFTWGVVIRKVTPLDWPTGATV